MMMKMMVKIRLSPVPNNIHRKPFIVLIDTLVEFATKELNKR